MMLRLAPLALAIGLAAPVALAADDIYRSVMPDGSVRYGESPVPGARSVRKIAPPPAATGTITVTPEEKARTPVQPQPAPAAVLGGPPRPAPTPAQQGLLQSPTNLPQRSY